MAITSLTSPRVAARSTVALKALMAVTGLIMIGYLLAHMYGNLKVFSGESAFNDYAHHLRVLGEPSCRAAGCCGSSVSCCWRACSPTCMRRSNSGPGLARPAEGFSVTQQPCPDRGSADLRLLHLALGRDRHRPLRALPPDAPDLEHRRPRWGGARAVRPGGQRLPDLVGGGGLHHRHGGCRLPPPTRRLGRADHAGRHVSSLARRASTCWRTPWPASSPSASCSRRTRSPSGLWATWPTTETRPASPAASPAGCARCGERPAA